MMVRILLTGNSMGIRQYIWIRDSLFRRYGHVLQQFDPKAEARLCRKIDLYIVPTVSLLYLFCFIDRANIGMHLVRLHSSAYTTNKMLGNARLAG
jgi:hypothetical protein